MLEYLQELSYTAVPVIIFVLGLAFIYREYLNHRANFMEKELTLLKASQTGKTAVDNRGQSSPADSLRIQAYERLVLYLERIAPNALIMRLHQHGMSADAFRNDMTRAIREEFDHNLSQQIYVSEPLWRSLLQAKDETIQLINIAHKRMEPKATGLDMSRHIFDILTEVKKAPNEDALNLVRAEARKMIAG